MILRVLSSVLRHCIKFRFCSPLRGPFGYPFTPHAVISSAFFQSLVFAMGPASKRLASKSEHIIREQS